MRIGIVGTGAIARLHARVYKTIGFSVRACTNRTTDKGRQFAADVGAEYLPDLESLCAHHEVDVVDVCTLPQLRIEAVNLCAQYHKAIQLQKPIATTVDMARSIVATAAKAGIALGVVSQHRFDESIIFLRSAIAEGRLGTLLQVDAYVKWFRTAEYYARPGKGTWAVEGGGALINQAIHQLDLMQWLAGPVREASAMWQLGAAHEIESEDIVNALVRFESGATGVLQASTAFTPGFPERLEIHGTRGSAVITGDQLTTWAVPGDPRPSPPLAAAAASGASDPMAIALEPFARQFQDFADAVRTGRQPKVSGEEGLRTLEVVDAIYQACRAGHTITLARN